MIMCLDVGNSQIYGGVFDGEQLRFTFRKTTTSGASSDEYGLFLKSVLKENGIDPEQINQISLCTVVPHILHSLKNGCLKYFKLNPFVLQAGVKTGLKIKYRNPLEVGADRIATSVAATHLFPGKNVVVIDFGTATTLCSVNSNKEYLGGTILAGLKISMEALEGKTSKLPSVEIKPVNECLGRSTVESIQSGLFYGHLGAIKEILSRIQDECFDGDKPVIIGTGGFASLYARAYDEKVIDRSLFDLVEPDLVLKGLYLALKLNA